MGNMITDQLYLATKEDRANNFLFVRLLKPLVGWGRATLNGGRTEDPLSHSHNRFFMYRCIF